MPLPQVELFRVAARARAPDAYVIQATMPGAHLALGIVKGIDQTSYEDLAATLEQLVRQALRNIEDAVFETEGVLLTDGARKRAEQAQRAEAFRAEQAKQMRRRQKRYIGED